jgi:NAD-dependent oxidoreductase involved in siderophore biosynthesis
MHRSSIGQVSGSVSLQALFEPLLWPHQYENCGHYNFPVEFQPVEVLLVGETLVQSESEGSLK